MNTRLVNYPLFDRPVPIASALIAVASQENHDGPEDDLMVRAAKYILVLEHLVEFLYINHDFFEIGDHHIRKWICEQNDPGIARQAINIYRSL